MHVSLMRTEEQKTQCSGCCGCKPGHAAAWCQGKHPCNSTGGVRLDAIPPWHNCWLCSCCRVRIVINADGRPSGMAFVEFASPEDAATAMAKVLTHVVAAIGPIARQRTVHTTLLELRFASDAYSGFLMDCCSLM
jgi:RNA recognition motif. (a.k.a. RRM, RBD, or RNP domain)